MNRIAEKIIRCLQGRPLVLSVSHSDIRRSTGGTEKLILNEKNSFQRNSISYLHIFPVMKKNKRRAFGFSLDGKTLAFASLEGTKKALYDLHPSTFQQIHIHHFLHIGPQIMAELMAGATAPIRVFIHDFYTSNDVRFPPHSAETLKNYTEFFKEFADEIVAPSDFASETWLKGYPEYSESIIVSPHWIETGKISAPHPHPSARPRIAYVGYSNTFKGFETWLRFVGRFKSAPYDLYHLGDATIDYHGARHCPVSIDGENSMIRALKENEIDIAILWSSCPETYSFTLYESIAAGTWVVTQTLSGNIQRVIEQSAGPGIGKVFPSEKEFFEFFSHPNDVLRQVEHLRKNRVRTIYSENESLGLRRPEKILRRELAKARAELSSSRSPLTIFEKGICFEHEVILNLKKFKLFGNLRRCLKRLRNGS